MFDKWLTLRTEHQNKRIMRIQRPIYLIVYLMTIYGMSAQNCDNIGFENGNADGWLCMTGSVSSSGATFTDTSFRADRHAVIPFGVGFDPIAELYCEDNQMLFVTPPSMGAYVMRLGNEDAGAQAERVQYRMTVTPENNFFVLSYAVILEDPQHSYEEQPRFEMRILNSDGEVFPCGEYRVRADLNLEGFENCESWRVRPWTTVGFELQSYLGQEIFIELTTTDCSLGAHAGYAYFNADCRPLEITLLNYCADSTGADFLVTAGFDRYEWSTGDTTAFIHLDEVESGEPYFVTVTSATGCSIVLSDTIPELGSTQAAMLDTLPPQRFCTDTSFWFRPPGQNLNGIYSLDFQIVRDSFLILPGFQSSYSFVAIDDNGCSNDTVEYVFIGPPKVLAHELVEGDCVYESVGVQLLDSTSEYSYQWSTGDTTRRLTNVPIQAYSVTITNYVGCQTVHDIPMPWTSPIHIRGFNQMQGSCTNATVGSAEILFDGTYWPMAFSVDSGASFNDRTFLDSLPIGELMVIGKDDQNCFDTAYLTIDTLFLSDINYVPLLVNDTCDRNTGVIAYSNWHADDILVSFDMDSFYTSIQHLDSGSYTLYVQFPDGCIYEDSVFLDAIGAISLDSLTVMHTHCDEENGSIDISFTSKYAGHTSLNGAEFFNKTTYTDLALGDYSVVVKSALGCVDEPMQITILPSEALSMDVVNKPITTCVDLTDTISLQFVNGTPPLTYKLGSNDWSDQNEFINLPAGTYNIVVMDDQNCLWESDFVVNPSSFIFGHELETFASLCGANNGSVRFEIISNYPVLSNVDSHAVSGSVQYDLAPGQHVLLYEDGRNCRDSVLFTIDEICKAFVPTAFSPNNDNINDVLRVFSNLEARGRVVTYAIYNRWGGRTLYQRDNFQLEDINAPWWDGTLDGKPASEGVYVFKFVLEFANGKIFEHAGDVHLIR